MLNFADGGEDKGEQMCQAGWLTCIIYVYNLYVSPNAEARGGSLLCLKKKGGCKLEGFLGT